jgi:hypothetical protein
MPSQIRYFWWFGVVLVLFWAATTTLDTISALAYANKLPDALRGTFRLIQVVHAVVAILIWGGIVLLAAWLAAFRRKGWARYLFVVAILTNLAIPILVALYYYGLNVPWSWLAPRTWLDPRTCLTVFLFCVAVFFAFSEPAQRWFQDGKS